MVVMLSRYFQISNIKDFFLNQIYILIVRVTTVNRIVGSDELDEHGLGKNFSSVLRNLMTNYDPRLRPNFGRE
jgi:hypothetical protein